VTTNDPTALYGPWEIAGCQVRIDFSHGIRLVAERDGERLRAVPNAVRQSEEMAWVKLTVEAAKGHYRNLIALVEDAMVEGIPFSSEDLALLALDPVGRSLLERILVRMGDVVGRPVPDEWLLEAGNGDLYRLEAPVLVQHPLPLEQSGTLPSWDRWLNRQPFEQPFKQIRRELFTPNDADRANRTFSARWAEEEVRWDQARALLEGRGWYRVTKSGAERKFRTTRLTAYLEFRTPAARTFDREHVVLNRAFFLPSGELPVNKENPGLPLSEVSPIVFSETIRDWGLIGSVAGVERTS
jgi:hypothetical protein